VRARFDRWLVALTVVALVAIAGVARATEPPGPPNPSDAAAAWGGAEPPEPPGPLAPSNAGAPPALEQCGECHMVFSSRMLPSRSWAAILSKMDDHFGEDAAIPKRDLDEIRAFLTSHAADSPDATPRDHHFLSELLPDSTPLRITATPWWNQVHADFDFEGVKHTSIKSAANCLGCHYGKVIR
jgi:hypothetical protein